MHGASRQSHLSTNLKTLFLNLINTAIISALIALFTTEAVAWTTNAPNCITNEEIVASEVHQIPVRPPCSTEGYSFLLGVWGDEFQTLYPRAGMSEFDASTILNLDDRHYYSLIRVYLGYYEAILELDSRLRTGILVEMLLSIDGLDPRRQAIYETFILLESLRAPDLEGLDLLDVWVRRFSLLGATSGLNSFEAVDCFVQSDFPGFSVLDILSSNFFLSCMLE